jgi:hypothetical protein
MGFSSLAQQPATNKVKKNVQIYVDSTTDVSKYDLINYSELADRKLKSADFKNKVVLTENTNVKPLDTQSNNESKNVKSAVNNLEKDSDNKNLENTNSLNVENTNTIKNSSSDKALNTVNVQDVNKEINKPESLLDKRSTQNEKTIIKIDSVTTVKTIKEYKSPTAVEKKAVDKKSKNTVSNKVKPELKKPIEIVEEKSYPGVSAKKSTINSETNMLDELIKSGLYEVSEDGKYIRLSKRK